VLLVTFATLITRIKKSTNWFDYIVSGRRNINRDLDSEEVIQNDLLESAKQKRRIIWFISPGRA
jgi:hypothetical protein